MHAAPLSILVAFLVATTACSDDPLGPTPLTNAGNQVIAGTRLITVGQPFAATIVGSEAPCGFGDVFGPCRRFRVAAARTGFLRIGIHWSGDTTQLRLVPLDRSSCCVSSLFTTCQVRSGSVHDFAVVMLPRPDARFAFFSQAFALITSFDTSPARDLSCR